MRIRKILPAVLAASLAASQVMAAGAPAGAIANPHPVPKNNLSQSTASSIGPGQANSRGSTVNVRGCNHTNSDLLIAMLYTAAGDNSGDWKSQGWYKIGAGQCRALFDTNTARFFLRAEEDNGDLEWGADKPECVLYPGPFDYTLASGQKTCPDDGMTTVNFIEVVATQYGTYTHNFEP